MLKTPIFVLLLALLPGVAWAAGKAELINAPIDLNDRASLQRGLGLYMNTCAACHSIGFMRYSRLAEDLGLSVEQIERYVIKGDAKIGDLMKTGMAKADGTAWFGKAPPDLSMTARGKLGQEDWIYTFLLSFYADESRPTGWNNKLLPNTSMPNVLWDLQGIQRYAQGGFVIQSHEAGRLSEAEFRQAALDIANFLTYVGEPARLQRERLGVWVLLFLSIFTVLAWFLKREYWKDVH